MAVFSTAVPTGTVASVFGNEFKYVDLREGLAGLPQKIAVLATFDPAKTSVVPNVPVQVFSGTEAGEKFGFGSPAHLAARQCLRKSRIVPVFVFPITEAAGGVVADGSILVVGTAATSSGEISLYIGGQRISVAIASGATAAEATTAIIAAITARTTDMPVDAAVDGVETAQTNLTSKYKGAIADDITIAVNLTQAEKDNTPAGLSFTITAMTNGAGVPTVTTALGNMGEDWYTFIVNTFGPDSAVMAELAVYNEANGWDPLKNIFYRAFYGTVGDFSTVTTITDALKLDRTNASIPSPGAYALPLELAALAVGQMAARNQDNPPKPYTGLTLDGLVPGPEAGQWDHTIADSAEKLGASWTVVRDGVITLKDIVMHYHKTGEEPPAYRYAVDIAKLAEWAFNVKLEFQGENWEAKILIKDTDIVSNTEARRPIDAKAALFKIIDGANDNAIITDPAFAKANTVAGIDISNPNRLNLVTLIKLSGASRIISLTTNFGFNFGSLAAS